MYEYEIISRVGEFRPNVFNKMDNKAISTAMNDDMRKLLSEYEGKFRSGWEIVSHDVTFYENRQLLSVLIRH